MTADEIRQRYQGDKPSFDPADGNSVALAMVEVAAEIAAQLAELKGHPVAIDREATAHAIYGGMDMEFNLDQCRRMVDLVCKYSRK